MLQYSLDTFPSLDELIDSDDTPVDNEDQNLIPNFLLSTLLLLWGDRLDWFFGVDMGVFHPFKPNLKDPIVPDAFLVLGVERRPESGGRRSYRVWDEKQVPQFVLEMVSHQYNKEFEEKKDEYEQMGVLYYAVYIPPPAKRRKHQVLEVYRLGSKGYERIQGDPVWMPEIGLGIGTGEMQIKQVKYRCLLWYAETGDPYYPPEVALEQAEQDREQAQQRAQAEQQRAEQAQERNQKLEAYLRSLGLDPDVL